MLLSFCLLWSLIDGEDQSWVWGHMWRDFWLQALLGGGASVVLEGQRVVPTRTQDAGFRFQYNHIGPAISNIFR